MKKPFLPVMALLLLVAGCQKNENIHPIPNDSLIPVTPVSAVFSVSDSHQVRFSQGNLQYINGTWRFAEHQTDCLPIFNENSCDLFGWSTDISNWGINSSKVYDDYEGEFVEWGTNPDVVANLGEGWRTLSDTEWEYLLKERKVNGRAGEGYSWSAACINGHYGLIIYPDNYKRQAGTHTIIPDSCVFLPAVGSRIGEDLFYRDDEQGWYWSSSAYPSMIGIGMKFHSNPDSTTSAIVNGWSRQIGCSVRLVRDI